MEDPAKAPAIFVFTHVTSMYKAHTIDNTWKMPGKVPVLMDYMLQGEAQSEQVRK